MLSGALQHINYLNILHLSKSPLLAPTQYWGRFKRCHTYQADEPRFVAPDAVDTLSVTLGLQF